MNKPDKTKINNFIKKWANKGWAVLSIFFTVVYLTWRIFFTIPFGYGFISVSIGIALLIVEMLGMIESLVHYFSMYNVRDYKKPEVPLELFPDVDIFISTYNEDIVLVAKTVCACKRMEYPNPEKVHIYICDDGHREMMKMLARQLDVNYLDRDTHAGQKAGNLNHALANSSSPYVVTFDADMLPQSGFLMETMPYIVDAEMRNNGKEPEDQIKLGFIQTPQAFYDLDLFQFNLHSEQKIPNEQDYFYRDIEVARTRTNSCIYGGSNTIISRQALEDIGGFYTDAITEDFATGILIQKKGYVSLAIGKPLASGLSANELQSLIQQRIRWARGVISTGRKMHLFTSKDLSFGQKMSYWASVWYWYAPIKRFFYIMSPIIYATFGYMVFRCTLWEVLLFWLPMYVTSNISLRKLSNNIRNTKWTSIYEYAMFPYMLIPVLLETFGISLKKFRVTDKGQSQNKRDRRMVYQIPILILIVLSAIGVFNCVVIMFDSGSMGPVVVLFWLLVNLYNMIMCSFFISGRDTYRKAERVEVELPAVMHVEGTDYPCVTKDISETGAAIYMDNPHLLNVYKEANVILEITDRKYHIEVMCEVKFTNENRNNEPGRQWVYSMEFIGFKSSNGYDNLLAICYDRVPTKPQGLMENIGIYDDLSTNIAQRRKPVFQLKRHFPRINVNTGIAYDSEAGKGIIKVVDFNYQFISVEGQLPCDEVIFHFGKHDVKARLNRKVKNLSLYEVCDFNVTYDNQEVNDEIMNYILKIAVERVEEVKATVTTKNAEFNEMELV